MIQYEASPEKIAALMGDHIDDILQKEIAYLMAERMKPIIHEAATTIAQNLRSQVYGVRNYLENEMVFILKIDGVETAINDAPKERVTK